MFDRYNLANLSRAVKNPSLLREEVERKSRPLAEFGWHGIPLMVSEAVHRHLVTGEAPTSVWDRDWEVLVVLDACRAEWLSRVESEFDFLSDVGSIYSVGSHSDEWIQNTFNERYRDSMNASAYVTANHHAEWIDESKFRYFEDVTQYETEGLDLPAPPAHVVTDRAIDVARSENWDQMIVHYMQPHKPFFTRGNTRTDISISAEWSTGYEMYKKIIRGELTKEEVESAFIDNLRYVLGEVELLLENIDANTVAITSDHGNALGERYLWDHSRGVKHPSVRRVPWVECSGEDSGSVDPREYDLRREDQAEIEQRLEKLGYR